MRKQLKTNKTNSKSNSIDKRNKLNDLNAKQWIIGTKSVWTYSDYDMDKDITENSRHFKKLILFFTKKDKNNLILNPNNNEYINEIGSNLGRIVKSETDQKVDFILIEEKQKFSNYNSYKNVLLSENKIKYSQFFEILKINQYICVITRNFYLQNNSELILYHSDLNMLLQQIGFNIKGMIIWFPKEEFVNDLDNYDNRMTHDNILIFRKEEKDIYNKSIDLNFPNIKSFSNKTTYYKSFINSITPPRDSLKAQHPATFSEQDIKRLIEFFINFEESDRPQRVLDPFSGVGSTLLACSDLNIEGYGIELTKKWIDLTKERLHNIDQPIKIDEKIFQPKQKKLQKFLPNKLKDNKIIIQNLISGDSREKILGFKDNFFDFIVTSPPYWGILTKKIDHKTKRERIDKGFQVKYTIEGEDDTFNKDLGNIESYNGFLNQLKIVFQGCFNKLKNTRYMAVIVSDFRDKSNYYLFHCDLTNILREIGFKLVNITVLNQENKRLYPYGYPFVFVPNIHNQNIIIVKKENNS